MGESDQVNIGESDQVNPYSSCGAASTALLAKDGPSSASWIYQDLDGSPLDGHDVETSSADRPFEPTSSLPPPFEPFPVEVLPKPVRAFVCNAADALSVDHSFVALPVLAMLGAASGNTRLQIKEGWIEPPILWTAIVGNSGSGKTPALELALQALKDHELSSQSRHKMMMRKWVSGETALLVGGDGARSIFDGVLPPRPPKPDCVKLIADNATIAGLAEALSNEQQRMVVACDELADWLRSCTSRKNMVAKWRELFRGGSIRLPRKGRDSKPLHLRHATVCLTGAIQPETLKRFITRTQVDSGLAARLLFACPPARVRRWSDTEVDPRISREFVKIFDALSALKRPSPAKGGNDPGPQIVTFSPAAKDRFKQFVDEHVAEEFQTDDNLSSAWSKLQSYAARLALVIHLAKVTTGKGGESRIGLESIEAGITLSRWFGREARRIHTIGGESPHAIGGESPHEANQRKLIELIERHGGTMTARDLVRSSRRFANSRDAESTLNNLVEAGVGAWETVSGSPTGGRACRRFVLSQPAEIGSLSTQPPKT